MMADAYISEDGLYRYWLTRVWDESLRVVAFIGLNPSTADARTDDPTIRKEIGFAKRLGYGGILALNLGAFRATDPEAWARATDPIGPKNSPDRLLLYAEFFRVDIVIAAWGVNGQRFPHQIDAVFQAFPELWCLGTNVGGSPRHPLMTPYSQPLEVYGRSPAADAQETSR